MEHNYTEDNVSRLSGMVIQKNPELAEKGIDGYEEAVNYLKNLALCLICGDAIESSKSLQAALITSLNTGKRAFQGGVTIILKKDVPFLLPWAEKTTLNKVIQELGGSLTDKMECNPSFILTFGEIAKEINSLQVVCTGWRGGVCTHQNPILFGNEPDFALGGILAGSLAVGLAFLKVTGEKSDADSKNQGCSLWNPEADWLHRDSVGPEITYLPQKYWFVGLGHLGQAFIWTLGLLPFKDSSKTSVLLQDIDTITVSNLETGLLSEKENIGKKKTRVCSEWLEKRNFSPNIIEKKFDFNFNRSEDEPHILIRGLDSVKARIEINTKNFPQTIDCGIGGTRSDFDSISIFNLLAYPKTPIEIWGDKDVKIINPINNKAMGFLGCGLYEKTISTSFVGAFASTLVFSELIRAGFEGIKTSSMSFSLRNLNEEKYIGTQGNYSIELVQNGFV